jgi:hypothetical protein
MQDENVGGVLRSEFFKMFEGREDWCRESCSGFNQFPNTPAVIAKHWGFWKSATAALQFSFGVRVPQPRTRPRPCMQASTRTRAGTASSCPLRTP